MHLECVDRNSILGYIVGKGFHIYAPHTDAFIIYTHYRNTHQFVVKKWTRIARTIQAFIFKSFSQEELRKLFCSIPIEGYAKKKKNLTSDLTSKLKDLFSNQNGGSEAMTCKLYVQTLLYCIFFIVY